MPNRSPEEIRTEVSRSYGNRVRGVLNADESLEVINVGGCCAPAPEASSASCCGPETTADVSCCGVSEDETIVTNVAKLYAQADISDLPSTVTDVAFG